MKKRILLVDTSCVLHSVKYSLAKHKLSHEEKPTFVIYGFLLKMQFLMRKMGADITAFATDSKTSKRSDIYPEYKVKRKKDKSPEDIALDAISYPQFGEVVNYVLPKMGYKNIFNSEGLEGDDIIARVCRDYPECEIIVVSNDHDLYQLLSDNVCIFDPRANNYYSIDDFREQYGISPKMWKRVKAIGGCSSDEVKGVPIPQPDPTKKQMHVAEKGALNYIKGETNATTKAHQAIVSRAGKDVINRNKSLVVLPFRGTPKFTLQMDKMRRKGLREVCDKYNFQSILEDFEDYCKILRMR